MKSRTIETAISLSNIKAALVTQLIGFGIIRNDEDVDLDIDLPEIVPIKLHISKERSVRLVEYGKGST